jgi:Protein of unknown function (DUF3617)
MKSLATSGPRVLVIVFLVLTLEMALAAQSENNKMKKMPPQKLAITLQPLNIKLGLWETTRTITRVGQMPIPAGMLAKLSPEQRARIEERMKANSPANTSTDTDQSCITKDDLTDADFGASKESCTQTITSSTPNKASGTLSCEVEGMKFHGDLEIDALDQEHVKGLSHGAATGNGNTMNVESSFVSKWLRSSCGHVK